MRFIWNFQIFREKFFKFFFRSRSRSLANPQGKILGFPKKAYPKPSSLYQHVIALARFPLESGCKSRRFLAFCKIFHQLFSNKFCNLRINHWLSNMLYSRIFLSLLQKVTKWYILNIRVRVRPPLQLWKFPGTTQVYHFYEKLAPLKWKTFRS